MESVIDHGNPAGGRMGLRERRLEAGLSQERLARKADCSTSTVKIVERGYQPSLDMLKRIAAALGCEPADLFPNTATPPPANGGVAKTVVRATGHGSVQPT